MLDPAPAQETRTYTAIELLTALLKRCAAEDQARESYYAATLQIEKRDALSALNAATNRRTDAAHKIHQLLALPCPIDTAAVDTLLDQMQAAQTERLKTFASQVQLVLDAQRKYFDLAKAGWSKECDEAFKESIKQEKNIRAACKLILTGPLPQQATLF